MESKTWSEAQEYCRKNYDDLASLTSANMEAAVVEQDFPIWTGLHRDGGTWKWSAGLSDYTNWKSGEPGDSGDCVSISSKTKEMSTQSCDARLPVFCYSDNVVLVKENKTWEEALEHCRTLTYNNLRFDLLSVQPGDEHDFVMGKILEANTEEVWTGLRFLAGEWLWVNGADMLYTGLPPCPILWQHCGALSKINTGSVKPVDCMERKNFLCYSSVSGGTDLITIYSQSDANDINLKKYDAWIGLHKENKRIGSDWIWSDEGQYEIPDWRHSEPDKDDNCAVVNYPNREVSGRKCEGHWFFICQKHNGKDLEYKFIMESKTWSEAQEYCRKNYGDLASLTSANMEAAVVEQDFPIWTGLHRDGGTWKWSAGLSDYTNWKSGEPGDSGDCVSISSKTKEMSTQSCHARLPVFCYSDNVVLVKENKTWEEALEHCRTLTYNNLRFDLLSVQ
ncbi:C-type mannose receptor 2-like, partial [Leuresthes tenuis]|uniref:C-type mannose receptor 2-like n=1 Tax=Leuresthes tenuis TaxID=355514 RepID=UPI003B515379